MKDLRRSYSEIYEILNLIEEPYRKRIPNKFYDFINIKRDRNYHPEIRVDVPLEDQGLMQETIAILAMIKLDYLSNSDEKDELLEILRNNEEEFESHKKEFEPKNIYKENSEKVIEEYLRNNEIHVRTVEEDDELEDEDDSELEVYSKLSRIKQSKKYDDEDDYDRSNKEMIEYKKPNAFVRIFKRILSWFRR